MHEDVGYGWVQYGERFWYFGDVRGSQPDGVVMYRRPLWGDPDPDDRANPMVWEVELPPTLVSGDFPVHYVRAELEKLLASCQRAIAALDHVPEEVLT